MAVTGRQHMKVISVLPKKHDFQRFSSPIDITSSHEIDNIEGKLLKRIAAILNMRARARCTAQTGIRPRARTRRRVSRAHAK